MSEVAIFLAAVAGGAVGYAMNTATLRGAFQRLRHVKNFKLLNEQPKVVIVVRQDLAMTQGKVASQCAHAAVSCYRQAQVQTPDIVEAWLLVGQPKIVVRCNKPGESELNNIAKEAGRLGLTAAPIRDAGRTQVVSGTLTVVGIGPGPASLVNKVTGHLKVL